MKWFLTLDEIRQSDRGLVGGKTLALAELKRGGFPVPHSICIPAAVYDAFVENAGLRERIFLELNRKDFREMRWEEVWDAGLRIRNFFLRKDLLPEMEEALREALDIHFGVAPVAVRSSSIQEDSSRVSFAGLHESFINVCGADSILSHVKLVWASLWSDGSLLYRQELALDVARSAMAVLIQELVDADRSGIVFSLNPSDPTQLALEAVYGLNQGLVDGQIEPDRWLIDRKSRRVMSHHAPRREHCLVPSGKGVRMPRVPDQRASFPPLDESEVRTLTEMALSLEASLGSPQDVEWSIQSGAVIVLQSRPITTVPGREREDQRTWHLSLRRSFENLQALRRRIEEDLIPGMIRDHEAMASMAPADLSDADLAREIERRQAVESRWVKAYWDDFIPFAHGMRLFGQVYNDTMRPADPYEFLKLLGGSELESLQRNRLLGEMASMVRDRPGLRELLEARRYLEAPGDFVDRVEEFVRRYGDLSCPVTGVVQCTQGPDGLIRIVMEMAAGSESPRRAEGTDGAGLERAFLEQFQGEDLKYAEELLDLGRASYRMRDDDNIHLARIESGKIAGLLEAGRRLEASGTLDVDAATLERIRKSLAEIPGGRSSLPTTLPAGGDLLDTRPRQLVGQPAGPGLARGRARVIQDDPDLLEFRDGEILVCDAVDPNMTYVVPLAGGIVERRGGMLIHGAIIAREYGLPCVTGVPEVTRWVRTGDVLTVDGFLGIVTVGTDALVEST